MSSSQVQCGDDRMPEDSSLFLDDLWNFLYDSHSNDLAQVTAYSNYQTPRTEETKIEAQDYKGKEVWTAVDSKAEEHVKVEPDVDLWLVQPHQSPLSFSSLSSASPGLPTVAISSTSSLEQAQPSAEHSDDEIGVLLGGLDPDTSPRHPGGDKEQSWKYIQVPQASSDPVSSISLISQSRPQPQPQPQLPLPSLPPPPPPPPPLPLQPRLSYASRPTRYSRLDRSPRGPLLPPPLAPPSSPNQEKTGTLNDSTLTDILNLSPSRGFYPAPSSAPAITSMDVNL